MRKKIAQCSEILTLSTASRNIPRKRRFRTINASTKIFMRQARTVSKRRTELTRATLHLPCLRLRVVKKRRRSTLPRSCTTLATHSPSTLYIFKHIDVVCTSIARKHVPFVLKIHLFRHSFCFSPQGLIILNNIRSDFPSKYKLANLYTNCK